MKTFFKISLAMGIAAIGIFYARPQAETVPQTQTILKSYFITGAVPTQQEYDELIDTIFWYIESTYTNSQSALVLTSNSVNAVAASFILSVSNNGLNNPLAVWYSHNNGIASNQFGVVSGRYVVVTNYFSTPFPDAFYAPEVIWNYGHPAYLVTNNPNYAVIEFDDQLGNLNTNINYVGPPQPNAFSGAYITIFR